MNELYQEVIIDHSKHPRNFGKLKSPSGISEGVNTLCGDTTHIEVILKNKKIQDIKFSGSGCALTKASASIMTTLIKGKTIDEALKQFDSFHAMLTSNKQTKVDNKLKAFSHVKTFPIRVKCAMLPWHTLKKALEDAKKK